MNNPAQYGRNGDNTMVHMSNGEVAGLEALARANGTNLTTNPVTGYPEAFNLVPTLAGIAGGMIAGPWGAALGSGAATTAQTGSLEQGLAAAAMSGAGSAIGGNLAAEAGTQAATDAAGAAITPSDTLVSAATPTGGAPVFGTMPTPTPTPSTFGGAAMTGAPATSAGTLGNTVTGSGITNTTAGYSPMEANLYPELAPSTMDTMTAGVSDFATKAGDTMAGAKNVFSDTDKTTAFLKANQGNIMLGGAGMAGQAALEDAEAKKTAEQKMEADKFGEAQRSWQQIASTYGKYGKAPTAGMRDYASRYGVNFREGRQVKSPEQQAYEDQVMERYRSQVAEEPAYTRIPVEILDYFGVKDPYRLRRAMDANKEEAPVDKRAAGGYLEGGIASLKGDGMSDSVPAKIDGSQPAALSTGEYVIPADVVSHLGNGSSDDGAVRLDEMLDRVRMARTGTEDQAPQIEADKYLPA